MVYISTDYSFENRQKYLIKQSDYFSAVTLNDVLDATDKEIIYKIDKAHVISGNRIDGIYGEAHIRDISNGAKTVINLRNMLKKSKKCFIDITSCGDNAIEVLVGVLKEFKDRDIYLLTCVKNYISTTPIEMTLNDGVKINSFFEVTLCTK